MDSWAISGSLHGASPVADEPHVEDRPQSNEVPLADEGSHAKDESVHSEAEMHGERRAYDDEYADEYEDEQYYRDEVHQTEGSSSYDYDTDSSDEMRIVHANHYTSNESKIEDDEEYEKMLALPPCINENDEKTLQMVRSTIVGGMMSDFHFINEGVEAYQMNNAFGQIGLASWNLERLAEMIIDDETLEKCQQNPANLMLHPMIKDSVNFDNVNNKFKPVMQSELMKNLAAEIYKTGTANQQRKEVEETNKTQNMNQPENRKRYMAANDMLVNMMVRIYNDNCRTMDESVSWDEIRHLYEEFRDPDHRHHDLFDQYAKILPLEDAAVTMNPKSVKLIFGRSKLKDFLSDAIYHNIKFTHDKQIQLSLNDTVDNCVYKPSDYDAVEEEIKRRRYVDNPFTRGEKMTKEERKKAQKRMEIDEKRKTFIPIQMPATHVPTASEPPANIFGSGMPISPKREKEDFPTTPTKDLSPVHQHADFDAQYADDDGSSYCERPQEQHNFTDSEDEAEKAKKPAEKEPSPKQAPNPIQAQNGASSPRPAHINPFQRYNLDDAYDGGDDDGNDSEISSDCERPPPNANKNFTDDEDDIEERTREIEQDRRRKEEKRRRALEQKQKKEQEGAERPTNMFTQAPVQNTTSSPVHNGALIVPTPPEDRLNLALNIETVEEKAEVSNTGTSAVPDVRLQSFVNNSDQGVDDLSEDELFKTDIIQSTKPIYQRPQMPNEQHPLHRQQKELEHQQILAEKERLRKEKEEAKKKQEEEQRKAAAEEAKRLAEDQRLKKEMKEAEKARKKAEKVARMEAERIEREEEQRRLLEEHDMREREDRRRMEQEAADMAQRRSAFSNVASNPPMGLFSRVASNAGGSVFEEASFVNRNSPSHSNRSSSHQNSYQNPMYTTYQNSPRQQMAQDGVQFPRGPSRQANPMEPPAPQLGATRHATSIRLVDVGTQSEPIDAIFEELGIENLGGKQRVDQMSPKECFLQFIETYVYMYRKNLQQLQWTNIQKNLNAPFDRPESFLGENWTDVIERENPNISAIMTRKSGILFEWVGD